MSWRGIFIADDSSWPGLGFNPARGEVAAIDHLAADLKAVGRGLDELHGLVTGVGKDHGFWRGEELHTKWREAAARAEHAIREATDLAPESIGLWERVTDSLKGALHDFTDWLVEHADTLSTISSGLALAAVAVQAIPVVGQAAGAVLGTGAVLCSAGALVGHAVGMRRGNGSGWLDLAGDALGVVPGGMAAGRGLKAGTNLVKGGSRLAVMGSRVRAVENFKDAGKALRAGGGIVNNSLRAGLAQKGIDRAAIPLAKRFGVDLAGETLHTFQIGSQSVIRGGTFAHKVLGGE